MLSSFTFPNFFFQSLFLQLGEGDNEGRDGKGRMEMNE